MITVRVKYADGSHARPTGRIASFEVSGHAGYARRGQDIVCAAVSAVTQTAVAGLREVAGLDPQVSIDHEMGYLAVDLGRDMDNGAAQAILATMLIGLRAIARDNPRYVKIEDSD